MIRSHYIHADSSLRTRIASVSKKFNLKLGEENVPLMNERKSVSILQKDLFYISTYHYEKSKLYKYLMMYSTNAAYNFGEAHMH